MNIPFTCDFNAFSELEGATCSGLSYVATNRASLTSLSIDRLVGTPAYITDFTSIGINKNTNKSCFF